jgi:hypothetical protein
MTLLSIADINLELSYDHGNVGSDGKGVLTGKATYNGTIAGMNNPFIDFCYKDGKLQLLNWDFLCDLDEALDLASAIEKASEARQEKCGALVKTIFNKAITTEFNISLSGISASGGFAIVNLTGTYNVRIPSVQSDPVCRVVMDPIPVRIPISTGKDGIDGVIRDTLKENAVGIANALLDNWGNCLKIIALMAAEKMTGEAMSRILCRGTRPKNKDPDRKDDDHDDPGDDDSGGGEGGVPPPPPWIPNVENESKKVNVNELERRETGSDVSSFQMLQDSVNVAMTAMDIQIAVQAVVQAKAHLANCTDLVGQMQTLRDKAAKSFATADMVSIENNLQDAKTKLSNASTSFLMAENRVSLLLIPNGLLPASSWTGAKSLSISCSNNLPNSPGINYHNFDGFGWNFRYSFTDTRRFPADSRVQISTSPSIVLTDDDFTAEPQVFVYVSMIYLPQSSDPNKPADHWQSNQESAVPTPSHVARFRNPSSVSSLALSDDLFTVKTSVVMPLQTFSESVNPVLRNVTVNIYDVSNPLDAPVVASQSVPALTGTMNFEVQISSFLLSDKFKALMTAGSPASISARAKVESQNHTKMTDSDWVQCGNNLTVAIPPPPKMGVTNSTGGMYVDAELTGVGAINLQIAGVASLNDDPRPSYNKIEKIKIPHPAFGGRPSNDVPFQDDWLPTRNFAPFKVLLRVRPTAGQMSLWSWLDFTPVFTPQPIILENESYHNVNTKLLTLAVRWDGNIDSGTVFTFRWMEHDQIPDPNMLTNFHVSRMLDVTPLPSPDSPSTYIFKFDQNDPTLEIQGTVRTTTGRSAWGNRVAFAPVPTTLPAPASPLAAHNFNPPTNTYGVKISWINNPAANCVTAAMNTIDLSNPTADGTNMRTETFFSPTSTAIFDTRKTYSGAALLPRKTYAYTLTSWIDPNFGKPASATQFIKVQGSSVKISFTTISLVSVMQLVQTKSPADLNAAIGALRDYTHNPGQTFPAISQFETMATLVAAGYDPVKTRDFLKTQKNVPPPQNNASIDWDTTYLELFDRTQATKTGLLKDSGMSDDEIARFNTNMHPPAPPKKVGFPAHNPEPE